MKCIGNEEANTFIEKQCHTAHEGHKLWFMDPYGYTQIKKLSITKIMEQGNSEVLMFIPLTFIYRFLNGNLQDANLQGVANFLKAYSIDQKEAKQCSSALGFADLISCKLQKEYGHSWHATINESGQFYSLVFISKHHYGLEKFLEARDSILKDPTTSQLSLIPIGKERDLLELLPKASAINNCELYLLALNNGFSPSSARGCLESLEKRGAISVTKEAGIKRKKGHFFLGNKYYQNSDIRVQISIPLAQASLL